MDYSSIPFSVWAQVVLFVIFCAFLASFNFKKKD